MQIIINDTVNSKKNVALHLELVVSNSQILVEKNK